MLITVEVKTINGLLKTRRIRFEGYRKEDSKGHSLEFLRDGKMAKLNFPTIEKRDLAFDMLRSSSEVLYPAELFWHQVEIPDLTRILQPFDISYLKRALGLAYSYAKTKKLDAVKPLSSYEIRQIMSGLPTGTKLCNHAKLWALTLPVPRSLLTQNVTPLTFYKFITQ